MGKNTKEFTGTWMPAHIIDDLELSSTAKILYAHIASFETCFASNAWLAKRINKKTRMVQTLLNDLEERGYIARFEDEDKGRYIIAILNRGVQKNAPINNNINKSIDNSIVSLSEDIKKLYHGWLIEFHIGNEIWLSLDGVARSVAIERAEKKTRLTDKRKGKINLRLKDAGFAMCARAIKNLAKSDFHRGENNTGWKASIEWLFNSYEKIEEWSTKS